MALMLYAGCTVVVYAGASPAQPPTGPGVTLRPEHHLHLPSRRLSEHLKALNGKYTLTSSNVTLSKNNVT